MIRKVLKILLKIFISLIILALLSYYIFLGIEYLSGEKYVKYISQNCEIVAINDSFSFELMKDDIEKNQLILVGESHGFEEPTKFDPDFFKHLYINYGVRNYIAELDHAQASLMNIYLKTGDETLLQIILKNWIVVQGRNNKDYLDKYREFHNFFQELPENDKFKFIGIDKIQDWEVFTDYVNRLCAFDTSLSPITFDKDSIAQKLSYRIKIIITDTVVNEDLRFEFEHLLTNIEYAINKVNREEAMFNNFHTIYTTYHLGKEKLYGYFGSYHVFQYRINGNHPFASLVRQSDLGLEDKILSMNFMFVDSYMVTSSKRLPEFIRDKGKYTRMKISLDNIWFLYVYGVMDFKRSIPENHKSIVKMNAAGSPYKGSNRLNRIFQILPVTEIFKMTDKGKPYIQYSIFVRNSDWAEPIIE